ncbi:hypothetical protein Gotur_011994 [Gossypium turneri]
MRFSVLKLTSSCIDYNIYADQSAPALITIFMPIDEALEQGVEAMRTLKLNGFNQKITRFNLGQKYKLLRQTEINEGREMERKNRGFSDCGTYVLQFRYEDLAMGYCVDGNNGESSGKQNLIDDSINNFFSIKSCNLGGKVICEQLQEN